MLCKLFFYIFITANCFITYEQPSEIHKKITVVGIALNDKDAAVVETDKEHYLIDGLDQWDEKYYHKKVKVTGILLLEKHKKQSTDSIQVQERVGTWRILKKAKWELVVN